ncbi:MAG: hypothetical protein ACUZ8N_16945 [Candidatus Scalindua sp.]
MSWERKEVYTEKHEHCWLAKMAVDITDILKLSYNRRHYGRGQNVWCRIAHSCRQGDFSA